MKDDLISRSALIAEIKRIGGQPFSEWDTMGVLALAERIPAVNAQTYLEQLELVKEAFDMAKSSLMPVVRCKDCKQSRERNEYEKNYLVEGVRVCTHPECSSDCWFATWDDHWCSYGERRADDGN